MGLNAPKGKELVFQSSIFRGENVSFLGTREGNAHDMLGFSPTWNLGWLNFRKWLFDTVDGRNPANHLLYMKAYEQWDIIHIKWCRISSINTRGLQKRWLKSNQKADVFWSNDSVMRSTVGFSKTMCCLGEERLVVMRRSFRVYTVAVFLFFSLIRGHLAQSSSSQSLWWKLLSWSRALMMIVGSLVKNSLAKSDSSCDKSQKMAGAASSGQAHASGSVFLATIQTWMRRLPPRILGP